MSRLPAQVSPRFPRGLFTVGQASTGWLFIRELTEESLRETEREGDNPVDER